jgi:hypothetical protein
MGRLGFVLKVGPTNIIENIDPFPILLRFVSTSNIQYYIHQDDFKELRIIEMETIEIYDRFIGNLLL